MPTRRFVQEKPCPHCGQIHSISINDTDLPCKHFESMEDELFISAEAESIELKESAFSRRDA